jgi:hypothetical protein
MSPLSIYIVVGSVFTIVIGYDIYEWLRGRTLTSPQLRLYRLQTKIKSSIVVIGAMCLIASVLFHINILRYRSPIPYSRINSITLKDFTGFRTPNETLHGETEFAFITTSIKSHISTNEVEVTALFHPSRSFVYNGNIPDGLLLTHELYHFHITEVAARLARQELNGLEKIPTKKELNELLDAHLEAENEMQRLYDEETYHGYVLKNQKAWQTKVDSLLYLAREFQSTKIEFE